MKLSTYNIVQWLLKGATLLRKDEVQYIKITYDSLMVKYRKPQTNNVIQQELEVCRPCCTRDFFIYQESPSRDSKRDKILKWFCFVYTLKDNWILGFLEGCQGYQLEWPPADNHCHHQSMIGRAMNLARFDKIQNFGHPRDLSRVVVFQLFEKKKKWWSYLPSLLCSRFLCRSHSP